MSGFLIRNQSQKEGCKVFQVLKENSCQPRIWRPASVPEELRCSENILRCRKAKSVCHQQTYTKRTVESTSLKRKEMI